MNNILKWGLFNKNRKKYFILNYKLKFVYKKNNFFLNFIFNNLLIKRRPYGSVINSNYYKNILGFISYMYNKKRKKKNNLKFFYFEISGLISTRIKFWKNTIFKFFKSIIYRSGYLGLSNNSYWSFNGCRLKSTVRKKRKKKKKYSWTWRNYFFNFFL